MYIQNMGIVDCRNEVKSSIPISYHIGSWKWFRKAMASEAEIIKGMSWKFNIPFSCGSCKGYLEESQLDQVI